MSKVSSSGNARRSKLKRTPYEKKRSKNAEPTPKKEAAKEAVVHAETSLMFNFKAAEQDSPSDSRTETPQHRRFRTDRTLEKLEKALGKEMLDPPSILSRPAQSRLRNEPFPEPKVERAEKAESAPKTVQVTIAAPRLHLTSDRLALETTERQSLEMRIMQLEGIIKSLVDKVDSPDIEIVSADTDQITPETLLPAEQAMQPGDYSPRKIKTGTPRLDDLLLGGIPFGSNVLLYGPPFVGKEVLLNLFVAEGVRWGTPAVWVLTDKSTKDVREEMKAIVPEYEEFEKQGIVRYVDAYSRTMGDDTQDPYTDYVKSPTDLDEIMKCVDKAARLFKQEHDYYRLAVRSLSPFYTYLDVKAVFKFLSPFAGRRKRDNAVAMYLVEQGVHGDREIQAMGSIMDGLIEFKVENLKTFMAIKGVCDVQSRAFVRYTANRLGVTIGSFSLDHIR
ncbi:MAG TPA: RAD55 family ATPase [Thermoplasmata archaeon]